MPKKKMWVEWEDGAELSQSRKKPGGQSPLTRDGDRRLGQVVLSDIDEPDDALEPSPPAIDRDDDEEEEEEEEDEDEDELTELEEAVAALVFLAVLVAAKKASPHLKRWWSAQAVPFFKRSRARLSRGSAVGVRVDAASSPLATLHPTESSQDVLDALEEYKASMSSAEARERFVAALTARLYSDEQLRVLRNARIEGDGAGLELAEAMERLTPDQLGGSIRLMLEANPSWPDGETLLELRRLLERGMSPSLPRRQLAPGANSLATTSNSGQSSADPDS